MPIPWIYISCQPKSVSGHYHVAVQSFYDFGLPQQWVSRLSCSGLWCRVVWYIGAIVLEETTASNFRVNYYYTLNIEAARSSKMLVPTYQKTWRHIPKDHLLNSVQFSHANIISLKSTLILYSIHIQVSFFTRGSPTIFLCMSVFINMLPEQLAWILQYKQTPQKWGGCAVCIQTGDTSLRNKYCIKWMWNWSA